MIDNKWHKEDNKLFANPIDILDTNKSTLKFNTIFYNNFKTYPYLDKLYSLSFILDIQDLRKDKEYYKKDDATFENPLRDEKTVEKSCL